MKMTKFRNAVLVAALAAFAMSQFVGEVATSVEGAQAQAGKVNYAPIPGGDYRIDPAHSMIGFSIRHYEINWVEGRFKDFEGVIRFDDSDITKSSVEFKAKIASIDTGVVARDNHLRTPDFFDAAKYPEMTFKSVRVERKGKDGYILHGDFTLREVTKRLAIPFAIAGAVKDPRGNIRFGIEAHTKIDRRDFGVGQGKAMEGGGLDIGNEVTINLLLEAMKITPKAPASSGQ
jgi:polyisoprenoid-binding protein YceI